VVVLPAILLVLLTLKMYMLEVHGIAEPSTGPPVGEKAGRDIPIFPDVTVYLLGLAAMFGSAMLLISAILPLSLPPEYTPQLAAQFTPQPDWYFLWIYQILKISIFEGPGLPIALTLVTLIFVLLVVLPFVDRGSSRHLRERPTYVTIGLIFVAELFVLAYWGLESPGQVIPTEAAALVLGGTAVIVAIAAFVSYSVLKMRSGAASFSKAGNALRTAMCFVLLIAGGSIGIGWSLNSLVRLIALGVTASGFSQFGISIALLSAVIVCTLVFLYRLELADGSLKRRVRLFEIGGKANELQ
jgi:hypothetical protein